MHFCTCIAKSKEILHGDFNKLVKCAAAAASRQPYWFWGALGLRIFLFLYLSLALLIGYEHRLAGNHIMVMVVIYLHNPAISAQWLPRNNEISTQHSCSILIYIIKGGHLARKGLLGIFVLTLLRLLYIDGITTFILKLSRRIYGRLHSPVHHSLLVRIFMRVARS